MTEQVIKAAHSRGMVVNGTVSTFGEVPSKNLTSSTAWLKSWTWPFPL